MDLSAVADVATRIAEIRQRVASPWSFASVLSQMSQGAAVDGVPAQPDTAAPPSAGYALTSYLFGQRLGGSPEGGASVATFGEFQSQSSRCRVADIYSFKFW